MATTLPRKLASDERRFATIKKKADVSLGCGGGVKKSGGGTEVPPPLWRKALS